MNNVPETIQAQIDTHAPRKEDIMNQEGGAVSKYNFESMTRDEALDALADLDARRWGETERATSKQRNGRVSRGLLINSIVHHVMHDYGDAISEAARAIAKAQLTADDRDRLRSGG